MPEPFRLSVLKNLTSLLQTITPANGYSFDMSESVFRGRAIYGDDDPVPMISIIETPIPEDAIAAPVEAHDSYSDWNLLVQGWVADDPLNPTDPAHYLMAEVKQALAKEKLKYRTFTPGNPGPGLLNMSGKVDKIIVGTGVVRPADELNAHANFWLSISLKIVEDNLNPYV